MIFRDRWFHQRSISLFIFKDTFVLIAMMHEGYGGYTHVDDRHRSTCYWFNYRTKVLTLKPFNLLTLTVYPRSTLVFRWVFCYLIFFFCVVFCISLFVLLSFFHLAIALSTGRFTASGFPFGILDLRVWFPLWYLRFTASGFPFGILDWWRLVSPLVS